MKRILSPVIFIALLLAGCGPDPIPNQIPGPTFPPPTKPAVIPETAPEQEPVPERTFIDQDIEPPGLVQDASDLVSASGNCAACHAGLTSADGEDLSFTTLWRASIMAHAAKDPYWLATVSSETAQFPELEAVIADKCASCHMPLARFDAAANEETPLIFGEGFLSPANQRHDLALDGVSCTLCHQVQPDNFGQADSYSGHYLIDQQSRAYGQRRAYAPLPISTTCIHPTWTVTARSPASSRSRPSTSSGRTVLSQVARVQAAICPK